MTTDPLSHICNTWQQPSGEPSHFTPEQLRASISRFERTISRRNLIEYLAAALVMCLFAYYAWVFPALLLRIGCILLILGTAYVVYQLHRRASARPAPADMAIRSCVDFQRAELRRQQDALHSVWSWYLLPFVPGMAIFLLGLFQFTMHIAEAAGRPLRTGVAVISFSIVAACIAIVFAAIWLLNRRAAEHLQKQIDELDRLTRDSA